MMQEEVADRITSNTGVKDYNALSIAIQYRTVAKKVLRISRNIFIPKPNVDSAVIHLTLCDTYKGLVEDETHFFTLVRKSFSQRRKTLMNNLKEYDKDKLKDAIIRLGYNISVRAEALSVMDFINLSNWLR
jgi:16S rRNA (adenine1518-N6/adenine1519-N6)-dimethyltransferase